MIWTETSIARWALRQPNLNVRLSAAYLSQLTRQFGGQTAYAVAAYNAGPAAVARFALHADRSRRALVSDSSLARMKINSDIRSAMGSSSMAARS
jgi:soluble lytic murein transglycosylase-like protein